MSAPGNIVFSTGFGILLLVLLCYAFGRLHQWYRHTTEREEAYREGYNTATRSLFALATRTRGEVLSAARKFEPGVSSGAVPAPVPVQPPKQPVPIDSAKTRLKARHRADPDTGDITDSAGKAHALRQTQAYTWQLGKSA